MSEKKANEDFEKELDAFFKDRAEHRVVSPGDKSKIKSAKERENDEVQQSFNTSGCCMTGCHDCPWDYDPGN